MIVWLKQSVYIVIKLLYTHEPCVNKAQGWSITEPSPTIEHLPYFVYLLSLSMAFILWSVTSDITYFKSLGIRVICENKSWSSWKNPSKFILCRYTVT